MSQLAAVNSWSSPIFDIHQHTNYFRRTDEQLLAHSRALGVTRTLLLPAEGWMIGIPAGPNDTCAALAAAHPGHFVRFANADPSQPDALATIRRHLESGAIGIGEQKFRVAVDGTEMRAVYDFAAERRMPVLIHFEHGNFNLGIDKFARILERYPNVNFIGHAQTWWGNISAQLDPADMYPKGPVKPGGITDRLLSDYPNMYGDLSAGSGLNALTRDADFARDFVLRHQAKLLWGSDCPCHDGNGLNFKGGCIGRHGLEALVRLAPSAVVFRRIAWGNAMRLLKL